MMDRAIESGKERRRPYRKAKLHSKSCRNHGGCPYCLSDRMHKHRKAEEKAKYQD